MPEPTWEPEQQLELEAVPEPIREASPIPVPEPIPEPEPISEPIPEPELEPTPEPEPESRLASGTKRVAAEIEDLAEAAPSKRQCRAEAWGLEICWKEEEELYYNPWA